MDGCCLETQGQLSENKEPANFLSTKPAILSVLTSHPFHQANRGPEAIKK